MRIQSKLALLATLAFPALSLAAYSMNLSGKVVDAGGQGVAQVEVALKGTEFKATTDASGAWVLQQESAALLGPTLSAAYSLSEGQGAYSVSGRRMGDPRQLAQGIYVQKSAQGAMRSQALAKEAGEKDSLIVSYQGSEVGRLEQADLLQGALPDMMFLTVSPTLTQGTDNSALASQFRLLGQTVLVNYAYDASLWRPSILTVGATKITLTDPSQKLFKVALGAQEDAAVNLALVTRLQTIAVPDIAGHTYGDAAFDVNATASSGLPVTIVSTTLSVCSVSNGQVNLLSAGSCALKATQAGNADYNAVEIALNDFTISKKTLTVSANDKVYDGSTAAALTLTGIVGSDEVTGNGVFASAQAGSDKALTDLALAGAQKDNYTLGTVTSLTASIAKKTLTVAAKTGANLSKVYDGTNVATLVKDTHYELTGVVGVDVVDIAVTGAIYNSANVVAAATATATFSDALMGADAGNYQIVAGSFNMAATITQATLAFSSANPGSLLLASSPVTHTFRTNADAGVALASSTPTVCGYSAGSLILNSAGLCTVTATPINAGNFTNGAQSQLFGVDRLYDERDGELYKIVEFGAQVWMAENLNYSRANTLGWCYEDNADNCLNGYGRVYHWADAMDIASTYLSTTANDVATNRTTGEKVTESGRNRGLCPTGWHVPSDGEWTTFTNFVEAKDGVASNAGTWLKAVVPGNTSWNNTSYNQQDPLGFSAIPVGEREYNGYWNYRASYANFWSASEDSHRDAYSIYLYHGDALMQRCLGNKDYGYSLRCLQD